MNPSLPEPESLADFLAWKPPHIRETISNGLLVPEGKMIIFGPKKSWKSMLVSLDMAFKLSTGLPWVGFGTRQCKVLVVQEEIPLAAFRERVETYANGHNLIGKDLPVWFNNDPVKLGRSAAHGYNNLLTLLKKIQPDVLILDPLYKVIWGNLVDTEDMSSFTDAVDRLIQDMDGQLAVVIVHHKGKAQFTNEGAVIERGSEAGLGSSIFNNWYDTGLMVSPVDEDTIQINFEDLRLSPVAIKPKVMEVDRATLTFKEKHGKLEGGLL
ncbi:hypothetical protein LCGC14_2686210 [marine sediment metagenome]|uniref:SF4 helicase domain-containing protein n=1 Tax=marine sediment metagenome TaxID=412755 RepID=A0A0F9CBK1_9ZZZZ